MHFSFSNTLLCYKYDCLLQVYASLLQVRFSTSSMLLRFKFASPLQVRFSPSSALLRFKCASPLQVRFSASSALLCFKYASPFQVRFSASSMLLRFKCTSLLHFSAITTLLCFKYSSTVQVYRLLKLLSREAKERFLSCVIEMFYRQIRMWSCSSEIGLKLQQPNFNACLFVPTNSYKMKLFVQGNFEDASEK